MQSTGVSRDVNLILLYKLVVMKQGPNVSYRWENIKSPRGFLNHGLEKKLAICRRKYAQAVLQKVLYVTNYNRAPEFYVITKSYSLIIAAINFWSALQ